MPYYSEDELQHLGFASVGSNVLVSKLASIYGHARIHLGCNIRIDDFCVLSAGDGGIWLGNYIHIAVHCSLIGGGRITLRDFCNLSSRVAIYSSSDDYSGNSMTNPMVGAPYTDVTHAPVILNKHVIVGCGSVVLPGVTLGEGVALGALSLANRSLQSWGVYAGQPARYLKPRSQRLLEQERCFLSSGKPC
ncbi:dTDP-4-amino-4,6-dideoxy-D-glucose acetyltransferase VioB [Bowmanella denitrificans]|uniref:dTDP-4-amino-4,6-dideoxy-D-glucose acetyltransferase VioB n=1 Tax=Bowmanella denitrificans TaxID=366582 RepID=A0ABP3GVC3_9ALTE